MPTYGQYDVPSQETMVNLGVGQPDNKKLPLQLIKNSIRKFLDEENNPEILQYGDIPGYKRFREKLAKWLTEEYYCDVNEPAMEKYYVDCDELFITNGVTQALHLIMTSYMYQEDTILVEDPSYFIMINIFRDFGLEIMPISMEKDGLNIEELDSCIGTLHKQQDKVFLYTIPINHNPSGITMSEDKRLALAELCEKYSNFYVLADEVYHFLSWNKTENLVPLADYHPHIVSINSFSKILAPSLRLGWIYQNKKFDYDNGEDFIKLLSDSGLYDSTGGTGVLSSYLTENLIDSGELSSYIDECKSFLGSRCKTICDELKSLKENNLIDYEEPNGGYFVWLKVNDIKANDLLELAVKNRVKFHPGWKFTASKDKFDCYLRLSCSFYEEEDLKIGISRLKEVISQYKKIKVSVLGANGKLGKLIVDKIKEKEELSYIGSIDRDFNLSHLYSDNTVIVDVSSPEGTNSLISKLIEDEKKTPVIIGTTGEIDINLIEKYSKQAPVAIISNFSDGIPTIMEFSNYINQLPDSWSCKMIEKHHINKKDKPSGTAINWANTLNRMCDTESIREGETFGEHKLVLSNDNEEIIIEHKAKNREIFAIGSLKYIEWILSLKPGIYNKIDYSKYNKVRTRTYSASGNILMVVEFLDSKKWDSFVIEKTRENKELDGLIFLERYKNESGNMENKWTYFNRDGSCVPFCGNGVRCIGKYLVENYKELTGELFNGNNIKSKYKFDGEYVYFDSPKPVYIDSKNQVNKILSLTKQFEFLNILEVAIIIVGVPHIVILCNCDIFEVDKYVIEFISYSIHESVNTNFNINFVNINDRDNFRIRTYERGVNAETGSCGSGSLASFFYLNKINKLNDSSIIHYINDGMMEVNATGDPINKKFSLGGKVQRV